ncbi:MAG: hypothetical protein GX564_03635, partial [Oligosphaeraceae bacterium]|nr:hypothetical protein [Oligosphaeraceae bacterium]
MANNDFDDILKSAFGEDEKPAAEAKPAAGEKPAAATAAGTEVGTTAPSAPAASSAAEKKLPFGAHGKGPAKPVLGGGKFARPGTAAGSPPATPAKAAAAAPPPPPAAPGVAAAPPAKAAPAASSSAPAPAALVLTGSAPLPATGQAGGGPSTLLLVLLLAITFISLLISGAALAKISSLRQEMVLLNA